MMPISRMLLRVVRILPLVCCVFLLVAPPEATAASEGRKLLYRARTGDVDAMRQMGKALWTGTVGRGIDKAGAVAWWKKAAARGDARSMVILGGLYEHGTFVPQEHDMARDYYQAALDRGYKKAAKHLKRLSQEAEPEAPELPQEPEEDVDEPDVIPGEEL